MKTVLIVIGVLVGLIAIGLYNNTEKTSPPPPSKTPSPSTALAHSIPPPQRFDCPVYTDDSPLSNLEITPEQLHNRLNQNLASLKAPYRLDQIRVYDNSLATARVGPNITNLSGLIDEKNGHKLREVYFTVRNSDLSIKSPKDPGKKALVGWDNGPQALNDASAIASAAIIGVSTEQARFILLNLLDHYEQQKAAKSKINSLKSIVNCVSFSIFVTYDPDMNTDTKVSVVITPAIKLRRPNV